MTNETERKDNGRSKRVTLSGNVSGWSFVACLLILVAGGVTAAVLGEREVATLLLASAGAGGIGFGIRK